MPLFELKLAGGKRAVWEGKDWEDAARRYVDTFRDATVVAWRHYPRHGLFAIERPDRVRIIEPTPGMGH